MHIESGQKYRNIIESRQGRIVPVVLPVKSWGFCVVQTFVGTLLFEGKKCCSKMN